MSLAQSLPGHGVPVSFVRMCEEVRGLGGLAWVSEVSKGGIGGGIGGGRLDEPWGGGTGGQRREGWKSWGEGMRRGPG